MRKVNVKAHPKSRQEKVVETPDGYEIWVREAPDKGKATGAVAKALAKHLGIAHTRVTLVSGAASRIKIFSIDDSR